MLVRISLHFCPNLNLFKIIKKTKNVKTKNIKQKPLKTKTKKKEKKNITKFYLEYYIVLIDTGLYTFFHARMSLHINSLH